MSPAVELPINQALVDKIRAQQAEAAKPKAAKAGQVKCTVSYDTTECSVTFSMLEFVGKVAKSSTTVDEATGEVKGGKTEGAVLLVNGDFTVNVPGLGDVTYELTGTWWAKAKVKI